MRDRFSVRFAAAGRELLALITEALYGLPCRCGRNPAWMRRSARKSPAFPA